jgi:Histidine kinase
MTAPTRIIVSGARIGRFLYGVFAGAVTRFLFGDIFAIVAISAAIGYAADIAFNEGEAFFRAEPWFAVRMAVVGLAAVLTFRFLARHPSAPPRNVPRWALQVAGVACAVPVTTLILWSATTPLAEWPFWQKGERLMEFAFVTTVGLLVSPWIALAVLVREKEAFAREQEMAFRLARSELERREQDARLHLMQAQVAPHFLFNTLANVQALVDAGSPKAPDLLRALTTYLRSAVPRLEGRQHVLGDELASVRAYLELMHMRMPDRLQYSVQAAPEAMDLPCPPLAIMTLVENAVRHGIDPCEAGGTIDVRCELSYTHALIRVTDTGPGLATHSDTSGTGLSTLRQRLKLAFGPAAALRLYDNDPHGFCAEIDIPIGSPAS